MAERKDLDRPATVILTVLGLLFLAASVPALPFLYCESPAKNPDLCLEAPAGTTQVYDVNWFEASADGTALVGSGDPPVATASHTVTGRPATLIVTLVACEDNRANPQLQEAASVTWTINNGTADSAPETFSCADLGKAWTMNMGGHADIATVDAANETAAREGLWSDARIGNATVTFTMTATASRGGAIQPPVPLPTNPSLSYMLVVSAARWSATIIAQPPSEVGK